MKETVKSQIEKLSIYAKNFLLFLFFSLLGIIFAIIVYKKIGIIAISSFTIPDTIPDYTYLEMKIVASIPFIALLFLCFRTWKNVISLFRKNFSRFSTLSWIISIILFVTYFFLFINSFYLFFGLFILFAFYQSYLILILDSSQNKSIAKLYTYLGILLLLSLLPLFIYNTSSSLDTFMGMEYYASKNFIFSSAILILLIFPFHLNRETKLWERTLSIILIIALDVYAELFILFREEYFKPVENLYPILILTEISAIAISITCIFWKQSTTLLMCPYEYSE
ncbi:MAG TPA: hypothetical protein PLI22_02950 [Caldisericia bacterium]|nr:hypothetical protein [Caldisericia bacterium]